MTPSHRTWGLIVPERPVRITRNAELRLGKKPGSETANVLQNNHAKRGMVSKECG